jgi:hypothetical protein
MSRAIGAPMTRLLRNAQLARNGNIELMANVNSGSREIDETDKILKESLPRNNAADDLWRRQHQPAKDSTTVDDSPSILAN